MYKFLDGIDKAFKTLLWGAGLSILGAIVFGYAAITDSDIEKEAKAAIEACERDLPRTQSCRLTAVPVEN